MNVSKSVVCLFIFMFLPGLVFAQTSPIVSLEYQSKPLVKILNELGKEHDLNYVASDRALQVAGNVSCRLNKVPLAQALQMICASCNLEAQIQGKFVVIRKPREGEAPRFAFPPQAGQRPTNTTTNSNTTAKRDPKPAPLNASDVVRIAERNQREQAKSEPKKPEMAKPKRSATKPFVGTVTKKGKDRLSAKQDDGDEYEFVIPSRNASGELRANLLKSLEQQKIGNTVAMLYEQVGNKRVIRGFVGGKSVKKKLIIELPEDK